MKSVSDLIVYLSHYTTDERLARIKDVLQNRTRHLALVCEDIHNPLNASAVIRSADCFGVQDVYVIENKTPFNVMRGVAKGADKWVDIHFFKKIGSNNTQICYQALREQGYTIVATSPHQRGYTLEDLPIDKKIALVFGAERLGLSQNALMHADEYVTIPTVGFTQSLNVSVTAALCTYALMKRIKESSVAWQLSPAEQEMMMLEMLKVSVKGADELLRRVNEL